MNQPDYISIRYYDSPKKGEIYLADIAEVDNVGRELKHKRPVVILSNNAHNYQRDTVRAMPLTKMFDKKSIDLSSQIIIHADKSNGLNRDSIGVTEHIKALSKQRLIKFLGSVDEDTMNLIHKSILRIYGIDVLYI